MKIIKLWHHINAFFAKLIYKLIYMKRFDCKKGVTWRRSLSLMIDRDGKVIIGENCFFNNYCSLNANKGITIGNDCIFGENVNIYDHNHRFSCYNTPIYKQGYSVDEIVIGNNCWIGSNVTILKGNVIGEHCVIGAGCVISGEVPSHTVVKNASTLVYEKIKDGERNDS